MSTKQCSKCSEWKDMTEFYKDTHKDPRKRTKDGFDSRCKYCMSVYAREHYQLEQVREAHRKSAMKYYYSPQGQARYEERLRNGDIREKVNRYRRTDKGRAYHRRQRERYPDHNKAQNKVAYAIRMGRLPHSSTLQCIACGGKAREYHHHLGYAPEHWLDVVPMCHHCHQEADK